jgi:hypothetical protein
MPRHFSLLAFLFLGLVALALLVALPGGAAPSTETAAITSRADENHATAGWNRRRTVEYVAFSRKNPDTGRTNAFLRKIRRNGSFTTLKLNSAGQGDVGGIFYGRRILYAQTHNGSYDLRVLDIPTGRRWVPQGVNTAKHEWLPTAPATTYSSTATTAMNHRLASSSMT